MRFVAYAGGIVLCALMLVVLGTRNPTASGVLGGVIAGLAVPLLDESAKNARYATSLAYSLRFWGTKVRISASYLYRVKVGDKYLLVRGSRIPDQFQPVGGVWKVLPEGSVILSSLGAVDDSWIPVDPVSESDLRFRIDGRHLYQFIRWFESKKGRETDPWREFYEELVRTGIVPGTAFRWINYRHIRFYSDGIKYSAWVQGPEWLIADIYELVPTKDQESTLLALREAGQGDGLFIWAAEDQIRRLAMERAAPVKTKISPTATWTL